MGGFNPNQPFTAGAAPKPAPAFDPNSAFSTAPAFNPEAAFSSGALNPQTAATEPKDAPTSFTGKAWDWLNTPLVDLHREGAGPIESGIENFAGSFESPLGLGLLVASFGSSALEQGLVKGVGMTAVEAAGAVRKAKLLADASFLTKYGYDFGTKTIPALEMNWGDYRAATNPKDKQAALDRLEEGGTEALLGALTSAAASHGVARDVDALYNASPKGRSLAEPQYADAAHQWQEYNQYGNNQAAQDTDHYKSLVPKLEDREAVMFNGEAGGDPKILESQAVALEQKGLTKWADKVRAAKQLSPEQIEMRNDLRQKYDADNAHLKARNLLPEDGGLENYMGSHAWKVEDVDPETGKPVQQTLGQMERDLLKKRIHPTLVEGLLKGLEPTSADAAWIREAYTHRLSNLVSNTNLSEALAGARKEDGSPVAAPGHRWPGYTRPVDTAVLPVELDQLRRAGKWDALVSKGRVYPVPIEDAEAEARGTQDEEPNEVEQGAKQLLEHNLNNAEALMKPEAAEATEIPRPVDNVKWMWRQHDYRETPLGVWRPIREGEPVPPEAITTYGNGPWPEQAIMKQGDAGFPSGAERIPHVRVPMYVHPEEYDHLTGMLESRRSENALVRAALKVSTETKGSLLALSPFHWATITGRTLESGLNPFGEGHNLARYVSKTLQDAIGVKDQIFTPKAPDYYNLTPIQERAIAAGTVVGSTRPGYAGEPAGEGVTAGEGTLLNRIPLVGGFNRAIETNLFGPHGWITSLKFDLFGKLSDEIRKSRPELSQVQADRIAAKQVNNKFGGLNYTLMGRNASTQNALRLIMLAPDFLESSGRSVLDVAGDKSGGRLLKSLVAFNVAHWLGARALNYLVSGDTHPEAGFAVRSKDGKRDYTLRSTLGDYLRFIQHPKDFLANRVNPIGVRAPAEIASGEDPFGAKVTDAQEFFDTLRQIVPIPAQGLLPDSSVGGRSGSDNVLQSFGIGAHKHFTPAETMAQQLGSRRSEESGHLEGEELARVQTKFKLEDQLRTAINSKDSLGEQAAENAIRAAATGENAQLSHDEANRLVTQAHKYPIQLQSTVNHLALEDAFKVWSAASLTEKRALQPVIEHKVERWLQASNKHRREENDRLRPMIQAWRRSLVE